MMRFIKNFWNGHSLLINRAKNILTRYNSHDILYLVAWRYTQVWLKGSVLKTDRRVKPRGGSNPSTSSIKIEPHELEIQRNRQTVTFVAVFFISKESGTSEQSWMCFFSEIDDFLRIL